MDTASEKEARRSGIESQYNTYRADIERQYIDDKAVLERDYNDAIKNNRETKEAALIAAGLNSDGSDPQERPTG